MGRRPANNNRLQRERSWVEMSQLGPIYVSSEVILYSIKDIMDMSGWSETTVQKLFNDPSFPSIDYGKTKLVENHALMQFLYVRHEKASDSFWKDGLAKTRRK